MWIKFWCVGVSYKPQHGKPLLSPMGTSQSKKKKKYVLRQPDNSPDVINWVPLGFSWMNFDGTNLLLLVSVSKTESVMSKIRSEILRTQQEQNNLTISEFWPISKARTYEIMCCHASTKIVSQNIDGCHCLESTSCRGDSGLWSSDWISSSVISAGSPSLMATANS